MKARDFPWLAALLLLCGVTLRAPLTGASEFFYRDVTRQYQPLQAQLDQAWAVGALPTWNASTQSGVPLLANLHAGAFAPWTPLFRLLPFHRAYALSVALAWLTLMAGLFCWLRGRFGVGPSLLAAVGGGFGGVVLGATTYLPFLGGLACLPWQLWALERPDRFRQVLWLSLLFSCQVLTGDPSTALMGALACALWAIAAHRPRALWSLSVGGGVALGLCALQLFPALTLYAESARAASELDTRLAWSFHPARTLEWLVRLPFGGLLEEPSFTRWDLAAGPDAQPFLLEHGWGLIAVLALGPGLLRPGFARRLGLWLIGLGLLLSLGRHLGPLQQLHALPPLSFFRFPERFDALSVFGATVLAAAGLRALLDDPRLRARWAVAWLVTGAGLGGLCLWLGGASAEAARWTPALLVAAGLGAVLLRQVRWAFLLWLVGLGGLDWALAARASILTLPSEPVPAVALTQPGGHRVWRENGPLRAFEVPVRGVEGFAAERRMLHATFASATPGVHGVDELGGYSPVSLKRWQRVIQATVDRPELLSALFDVGWFVSTRARARANPAWRPVARVGAEAALFASPAALGRVWTVRSVVDVPSAEAAVALMLAPGFEVGSTAVREGGAAPLPALGQAAVTLGTRREAGRLEVAVAPVDHWALVVISETWAPGWRAWVDGAERPVELLDGTLLGVAVPPGARAVVLQYEEPLFTTGLALSTATALGVLLAWVRRRRRRG